jgi:hypothetical protein
VAGGGKERPSLSSVVQETQLGSWNFKAFKLGIEGKHVDNDVVVGDAGEASLDSEQPKILAHLGFHAHPTKTPTITATQRGAMNIMSSLSTSTIVGLRKISNKVESKAITPQPKIPQWKFKEDPENQINKSNKIWKKNPRFNRIGERQSTAINEGFERERDNPDKIEDNPLNSADI